MLALVTWCQRLWSRLKRDHNSSALMDLSIFGECIEIIGMSRCEAPTENGWIWGGALARNWDNCKYSQAADPFEENCDIYVECNSRNHLFFAKKQYCLFNHLIFEHCLCVRTMLSLKETAVNMIEIPVLTKITLWSRWRSHLSSVRLQRPLPVSHSPLVLVF